jgi:hypothetical protein
MVHLLATRASLDLKAGRFEPAAASAVEARRLARSHGLLPAQVRTLEVLSSVWLARQGLYDDRAEDVLEEGTALARSIDMENDAVAMERRLESLRRSWDD